MDFLESLSMASRTLLANKLRSSLTMLGIIIGNASVQDILIQFMIEAVILSVAGGLVGTSIGVGGILLVATFTPLNPGISWSAIALATGVSGAIGLFFGVLPAQRAAQLDPIVALRTA